jgi:hypothetical protein
VILIIGFWSAGLPTIMHPDNSIAVKATTVYNANLYFFSWAAFATAIFLSSSLAQDMSNGVYDLRKTSAKSARWYGLTAASLVVMGSAIRIFKSAECKTYTEATSELNPEFCPRTKLAVSLGVLGFFFSLVLTYLTHQGLTIFAELVSTATLLIVWSFGVGYITFGAGPGTTIGNLYFSCWTCFILTVFLFGQNFRDYLSGSATEQQQVPQQAHAENNGTYPQVSNRNDDEI